MLLEISARRGHSLANGHVARLAERGGAKMVFNTDSHSPTDLVSEREALCIVMGAGLPKGAFQDMQKNALELVKR